MLPSLEWDRFAVILGVIFLAILVTNHRRAPRVSRILARNAFLVTLLVLVFQLVTVAFAGLASSLPKASVPAPVAAPAPALGDSVVGGPSLSAVFIDHVLSVAGSPAAGAGQSMYDLSMQYHIDDAYALATFNHESSYGKYGAAAVNHSLGNIICAGYPTCDGRFRSYASWSDGFADFYRLISTEYIAKGLTTLDTIIPVYAPSIENDVEGYIQSVRRAMVAYRSDQLV